MGPHGVRAIKYVGLWAGGMCVCVLGDGGGWIAYKTNVTLNNYLCSIQ